MSKNINVNVVFADGSTVTNVVTVDKNKYASLQSKACTKRTALQAKVLMKKATFEQVSDDWKQTVVEPWKNMVRDNAVNAYPETVRSMIVDVQPATNLLELQNVTAE